jgi:hypothetical protein
VSREVHAGICESRRVRLPPATRHIRRESEPGEAGPRRWPPRVATTHQHSLPEPAIGNTPQCRTASCFIRWSCPAASDCYATHCGDDAGKALNREF